MKASKAEGEMANGTSGVDNHVHLKKGETSGLSQNSLKGPNLHSESKQTLLHPPTLREHIVVNSEISICNSSCEGSQDLPCKVCVKDSDLEQFLNAAALQDVLYQYLQKEPSSISPKLVEVHLNSEPPALHSGQSEHELSVTSPMHKTLALDKVTKINDEMLVKPVLEQEGDKFQLPEKNINASVLPDGAQRKRKPSEMDEDTLSKCIKTSHEARKVCGKSAEKSTLEEVKSFLQSQLDKSGETLDHKIKLLSQRVDHTQCLRKHKNIAIKIVKKISKLDRRIDTMIAFQKRASSKKSRPAGEHLQNRILNATSPKCGIENGISAPSKGMPSSLNKTSSKNTESSEEVIFISGMNESSDVGTVNPAGVPQKQASVNASTSAETPCNSKKLFFIDLTAEGDDSNKGDTAEKTNSTVESLAPKQPQPVQPSSNQVHRGFGHLPPLPQLKQQQQQNSLCRFLDAPPPQKLQVAVAQVENPKGFGVQWNISKVDPRCAPLESFHVFVCQELGSNSLLTKWMKVAEIKARPLPMACSLAQLSDYSKCYFIVVSRDLYGRYGPFSDIQVISAR